MIAVDQDSDFAMEQFPVAVAVPIVDLTETVVDLTTDVRDVVHVYIHQCDASSRVDLDLEDLRETLADEAKRSELLTYSMVVAASHAETCDSLARHPYGQTGEGMEIYRDSLVCLFRCQMVSAFLGRPRGDWTGSEVGLFSFVCDTKGSSTYHVDASVVNELYDRWSSRLLVDDSDALEFPEPME